MGQNPKISPGLLDALGISSAEVENVFLLRQKPEHSVYRLVCRHANYVLKWFSHPDPVEPKMYALLEELGIPTLPIYARTDQALLLEDLEISRQWRLATDLDMEQAATGRAVASWYRQLHQAGRKLLAESATSPDFLRPWVDVITEENLGLVTARFELTDVPGWEVILGKLAILKNRYNAFPQTLNYSDFAAENLALSCDAPRQAIVFDYDCFSIGAVYSDWRNVSYSLQGAARQAFADAYGPVDPREKCLDEPLSILEGLIVAAQRSRLPAWAMPLLASVKDGALFEVVAAVM